jgi:hypothetical protein
LRVVGARKGDSLSQTVAEKAGSSMELPGTIVVSGIIDPSIIPKAP